MPSTLIFNRLSYVGPRVFEMKKEIRITLKVGTAMVGGATKNRSSRLRRRIIIVRVLFDFCREGQQCVNAENSFEFRAKSRAPG